MYELFNMLLLFCLCLWNYSSNTFHSKDILTILFSIIFTCIFYVIRINISNSRNIFLVLSCLIALLSLFMPQLVFFYPLILYEYFYMKKYLLTAVFIIFSIITAMGNDPVQICILCLLFAAGFYLALLNRRNDELGISIRRLRDSAVEQQMNLKHQNALLLESQNDKISIAMLTERNRIAREIHDNVGHMISRSILLVGALLSICKDDTQREYLTGLKGTLNDAMDNIRSSVHNLHDESVDLKAAITDIVNNFAFCSISLDFDASNAVPKEIKFCFISIVNEALNNVIKHSNATKVKVSVKEHPGLYQLLIEDNGTITASHKINEGIGLTNMCDRVHELGGIINIKDKKGFRIFISINKI